MGLSTIRPSGRQCRGRVTTTAALRVKRQVAPAGPTYVKIKVLNLLEPFKVIFLLNHCERL